MDFGGDDDDDGLWTITAASPSNNIDTSVDYIPPSGAAPDSPPRADVGAGLNGALAGLALGANGPVGTAGERRSLSRSTSVTTLTIDHPAGEGTPGEGVDTTGGAGDGDGITELGARNDMQTGLLASIPDWSRAGEGRAGDVLHRQGVNPPVLIVSHSRVDENTGAPTDRPYFKLFVPQMDTDQSRAALYARRKRNKPIVRLSFDAGKMEKKGNPSYAGSIEADPSGLSWTVREGPDELPVARIDVAPHSGGISVTPLGSYLNYYQQPAPETVYAASFAPGVSATGSMASPLWGTSPGPGGAATPAATPGGSVQSRKSAVFSGVVQDYLQPTVQLRAGSRVVLRMFQEGGTAGTVPSGGDTSKYTLVFEWPITVFLAFAIAVVGKVKALKPLDGSKAQRLADATGATSAGSSQGGGGDGTKSSDMEAPSSGGSVPTPVGAQASTGADDTGTKTSTKTTMSSRVAGLRAKFLRRSRSSSSVTAEEGGKD